MRILLVEDDPLKERVVTRIIRHHLEGVEVDHKDHGVAGLAAILEGSYKLLICDWDFPICPRDGIMSGAGAELVELAKKRGLPVIVCSSHEKPDNFLGLWVTAWNTDLIPAVRAILAPEQTEQ